MTYKTKQSKVILSCLHYYKGSHVTVPMISRYLENQDNPVGTATIYRQLEKLEKEGLVRKYILDGKSGSCFQFVDNENDHCDDHYHLKCEKCGKLIHLQCKTLDTLEEHVYEDHGFRINPLKTVFYGVCPDCAGTK